MVIIINILINIMINIMIMIVVIILLILVIVKTRYDLDYCMYIVTMLIFIYKEHQAYSLSSISVIFIIIHIIVNIITTTTITLLIIILKIIDCQDVGKGIKSGVVGTLNKPREFAQVIK